MNSIFEAAFSFDGNANFLNIATERNVRHGLILPFKPVEMLNSRVGNRIGRVNRMKQKP